MCECCEGDCKLCNAAPANGYHGFPDDLRRIQPVPIPPGFVEIINEEFNLLEKASMTQPLNEAYHHEVLEAYQKISDTFDEFTQLMRKRIPYEDWPERLKIAGVSDELKGEYEPVPEPCKECKNITEKCICDLEDIINKEWHNCSPQSRLDESFRSMMTVMLSWKRYLDSIPLYANKRNEIVELLKAQGVDPLQGMTQMAQSRLESIGRAHNMLMSIIDDDIFTNLNVTNPYWMTGTKNEGDKLYEIRCKLNCLRDNLWSVINILVPKAPR